MQKHLPQLISLIKNKKILQGIGLILVIAFGGNAYFNESPTLSENNAPAYQQDISEIASAFENKRSDVQVKGEGRVTRILPDDNEGSRHQKFIIQLSANQKILVAHNIDLAPRISELKVGDSIEFHGEYEWNAKGGVIHWTHHDPGGRHTDGWLKHKGRTYQ